MSLVTPLGRHRARLRRAGQCRVEVVVAKQDAALVRNMAAVLRDPAQGDDLRRVLITRYGNPNSKGLKALLEAAPLDGIDLERARDLPRNLEL